VNDHALSVALFISFLVVAAGVGAAHAGAAPARGSPELDVLAPNNELTPGERGSLSLQITNSGDLEFATENDGSTVTTARVVSVELESDTRGIEVRTGRQSAGTIASGSVGTVEFDIVTAETVSAGTYELDADVEYVHTLQVDEFGEQTQREVDEDFTVTVRVTDDARFTVVDVESDVAIGQSGDLNVTIRNRGLSTARDVSLTLQSTGPSTDFEGTTTATRYVQRIAPGEARTLAFEATVAPDSPLGEYAVQATVEFEGTDGVPDDDGPFRIGFRPEPERTVSLDVLEQDLSVGARGTVTVSVTNDGPAVLRDSTISLLPRGETTVPIENERVVGTLVPGSSTTVVYPLRLTDAAEPGARQLSFDVGYEDERGDTYRTSPSDVVLEVAPEQSFSLGDIEHTLRVGEEGTLTGRVINEGPGPARDAVLRLGASAESVQPQDTEYPLGTLDAGDQSTFSFPIDVTSSGSPGPRQFAMTVTYETDDGDTAESDALSTRVDIAQSRDEFLITTRNATVEAGTDQTVAFDITNNRDVPLRNVNAQAFADDPLSTTTEEAYVPTIAAGATTTIEFDLEAAATANARTYPLEIDFQYDEPDGDTKLSDTYQVPVEVTPTSRGGGLFSTLGIPLLIAVALVLAGGVIYMRR
jgi:hypothetical protein